MSYRQSLIYRSRDDFGIAPSSTGLKPLTYTEKPAPKEKSVCGADALTNNYNTGVKP